MTKQSKGGGKQNKSKQTENHVQKKHVCRTSAAEVQFWQCSKSADTTATQPVVTTTADSKGYSQDPRGANVPKDNTMLYVGLAGAGILLISGIAYMASKGK